MRDGRIYQQMYQRIGFASRDLGPVRTPETSEVGRKRIGGFGQPKCRSGRSLPLVTWQLSTLRRAYSGRRRSARAISLGGELSCCARGVEAPPDFDARRVHFSALGSQGPIGVRPLWIAEKLLGRNVTGPVLVPAKKGSVCPRRGVGRLRWQGASHGSSQISIDPRAS